MKIKISPSLMCMDLTKFNEQIKFLNKVVDSYHIDLMDGHFVPNITLSPYFVEQLKKITYKVIDCHMMVTNPENYIEVLVKNGVRFFTPHAETLNGQAFRFIKTIKDKGLNIGVALNPETPISYIKHYIHLLDKITVMTVDPGFAGQPFIPEMLDKIRELSTLKKEKGYKYVIEIDGSCNKKTFKILKEAGAEMFIVGSSGLFLLDDDISISWEKMMKDIEE